MPRLVPAPPLFLSDDIIWISFFRSAGIFRQHPSYLDHADAVEMEIDRIDLARIPVSEYNGFVPYVDE